MSLKNGELIQLCCKARKDVFTEKQAVYTFPAFVCKSVVGKF